MTLFQKAMQLWLRYYVDTEEFDRKVCRFQRDGVAIPVTSEERNLSYAYARKAEHARNSDAAACEIAPEIMRQARREVERLTYEGQLEMLRRFPVDT